jgi:hypothetical protein
MATEIARLTARPFEPVTEDGLCPQCFLPSVVRVDYELAAGSLTTGLVSVYVCTDCQVQVPSPHGQ